MDGTVSRRTIQRAIVDDGHLPNVPATITDKAGHKSSQAIADMDGTVSRKTVERAIQPVWTNDQTEIDGTVSKDTVQRVLGAGVSGETPEIPSTVTGKDGTVSTKTVQRHLSNDNSLPPDITYKQSHKAQTLHNPYPGEIVDPGAS